MLTNTTDGFRSCSPAYGNAGVSRYAAREMTDDGLLERIASGDGTAMRVLYQRYRASILHFVMRFLRNEAAAEDAVNEVFFDVWRTAISFEGRSQVSTWLMAIARNKALSSMRRTTEPLDDETAELLEDPEDDPEIAMQKNQQGSIMRKCLAQLSPAHREIIDLVYYGDSTIDEAAAKIGIPRNTVKTRMHYARKELEQLLGAQGITTVM